MYYLDQRVSSKIQQYEVNLWYSYSSNHKLNWFGFFLSTPELSDVDMLVSKNENEGKEEDETKSKHKKTKLKKTHKHKKKDEKHIK